MRRFLTLLLLLPAIVVTGTGAPVAAQISQCKIAEQVYGVTRAGDLIVQPFCALPHSRGYLPSRTLATFATEVPRLFYGGQLDGNTVVIYGVGDDGALRWYRENAATGRLEPSVVVGRQFGDWRNYRHLQSAGGGDLTGVDSAGHLWHWNHMGWRDGTDTWAANSPEQGDPVCAGARPVFVVRHGPERYMGVAEAASYVFCGLDGQVRIASDLPPGMTEVTMAVGPGVTYALRVADHRLTRMILDTRSSTPFWSIDAVAPAQFATIFTGRSIVTEPASTPKYEWQWTWYTE